MVGRARLFQGIDERKAVDFLRKEGAFERRVSEGSYVFREGDAVKGLFLLLEGAVEVEKLSLSGKRRVVNRFHRPGTVFGEVYVFLNERPYDLGCVALRESRVLVIPKEIFRANKGEVAERLLENMLGILAEKALFLNKKMHLHAAGSIRKKIALHLLTLAPEGGEVTMQNREELAEYLAVPRPSLSRELMRMQREGLIALDGRRLTFDAEQFEGLFDGP